MTAPDHRPPSGYGNFNVFLAFLWMLGAVISVILFIGSVHAVLPHIGRDLVSLGALSALMFLAVTVLLLSRYPGGDSLSDAIGTRRTQALVLVLAPLIGLCARGPAEGLRALSDSIAPPNPEAQKALVEMTTVGSPMHAAFMMIVMAFFVPLAEEVFFRGGVYGALRRSRVSGTRAAVVTSLGFALCHPQALLPIGVVALVLGGLRAGSGSLWPSLLAHAAFNAVEVLEMTTEWVPLADESLVLGLSGGLAGLLVAFTVVVVNSPVARNSRMREAEAAISTEMR